MDRARSHLPMSNCENIIRVIDEGHTSNYNLFKTCLIVKRKGVSYANFS